MSIVKVLNSDLLKKIGSKGQATDVAQFFYDEGKQIQLVMEEQPKVFVLPDLEKEGVIKLNNHKTVPLGIDNTFYYGAWPQREAPLAIVKKLKEKLRLGEKSEGFSYKLNNVPCDEYKLNDKFYIVVPDKCVWFEVQPIKWIYNPELKIAYTEKALWNSDESDKDSLEKKFWKNIFHDSKKMQEMKKRQGALAAARLKKLLETGEKEARAKAIHAIRLLRDKECAAGVISRETQQVYEIFKSRLKKGGK